MSSALAVVAVYISGALTAFGNATHATAADTLKAHVYVACQDAGQIAVIDPSNDKVSKRIGVARAPANIALSKDASRLVVAHPEIGKLTEIDTHTLQTRRDIDIGGSPFGLAFDGAGNLVVGDWNGDAVWVLDAKTFAKRKRIPVGKEPAHIVVLERANRIAVANRESGTVSLIDRDTLEVVAEMPSGAGTFALAATNNSDDALVSVNVRDNSVTLIQPEPLSLFEKVGVGTLPYGVVFAKDDRRFLVVNQQAATVSVISTRPVAIKATIKVGRYPEGIALSKDGSKAYVANWGSNDVSVIDMEKLVETSRIDVCEGPRTVVSGLHVAGNQVPDNTGDKHTSRKAKR